MDLEISRLQTPTSPRDQSPRRSPGAEQNLLSGGQTKKQHLGYLKGAVSIDPSAPSRQRAAQWKPSSFQTAPPTPHCGGHRRGRWAQHQRQPRWGSNATRTVC